MVDQYIAQLVEYGRSREKECNKKFRFLTLFFQFTNKTGHLDTMLRSPIVPSMCLICSK